MLGVSLYTLVFSQEQNSHKRLLRDFCPHPDWTDIAALFHIEEVRSACVPKYVSTNRFVHLAA